MNSLNILHISDAHIQLDAKEEVFEIVAKMINDAFKVQKEQDIKIDLVCFTGDLIQRKRTIIRRIYKSKSNAIIKSN